LLPIAFALLALMVRSAHAVLSLVVSELVAFGSMFGVTFAIDATMSLMMSLAIALSIDYGLFLSVTFRESLRGIRARRWPTRCRRRATRFWSAASR
jgi:predicted RND superfamily exporter protein